MGEKLKQLMVFMAIWILSGLVFTFFNERRCVKYGDAPMLFFSNVKMACER